MSDDAHFHYGEMVLLALDGQMDDEQFAEFDRRLREDVSFRQYYLKFMAVNTSLGAIDHFPAARVADEVDAVLSNDLWAELAQQEKTAETIEVEMPAEKPQIIKMGDIHRKPREINRFSLVSAMISVAALIALFLYIHFVPVAQNTETATIADGINAVWSTPEGNLDTGKRLAANYQPLKLEKGIAKLLFDNKAEIIVEAPAEIQILTGDQIQLNAGRLYARIPQEALGFSVSTPNSKVVDLGTEFAVKVDTLENTELHVIKGKTNLYYGVGKSKEMLYVPEGAAKKVAGSTDKAVDIPCQATVFVRQIDSQSGLVWKGENTIDLADIVNGGDGFGTGKKGMCIDPSTGRVGPYETMSSGSWDRPKSYLNPVKDLPAVDCVIVPGQNGGNLPIATTGLSLADFPKLLGSLRWPIQTQTNEQQYPLILNGQTYGVDGHSAILIHANCGMTFDLDAVRRSMPMVDLVSFKAMCGLNETRITMKPDARRTADVYVFLDGKQVLSQTFSHVRNNAVPVQINLKDSNPRFLTLLVCCGEYGNDYDWCIFGTPELVLKNR